MISYAPYIMLVQIEQSVCSFVRNLSSTEASVLMIIPSSDKLRYAKNDLMGTVTYPLHNADLYGVTVEAKIEKGIEPMLVIMWRKVQWGGISHEGEVRSQLRLSPFSWK